MRNKSLIFSVRTVVILALLLTILANNSDANGSMPYTEDALNKLNSAKAKIKVPADVQGDNDHKVKTYIDTYRRVLPLPDMTMNNP